MDARGGGDTIPSLGDARKLLVDASEVDEDVLTSDELGYGDAPEGIADGYWMGPLCGSCDRAEC